MNGSRQESQQGGKWRFGTARVLPMALSMRFQTSRMMSSRVGQHVITMSAGCRRSHSPQSARLSEYRQLQYFACTSSPRSEAISACTKRFHLQFLALEATSRKNTRQKRVFCAARVLFLCECLATVSRRLTDCAKTSSTHGLQEVGLVYNDTQAQERVEAARKAAKSSLG